MAKIVLKEKITSKEIVEKFKEWLKKREVKIQKL